MLIGQLCINLRRAMNFNNILKWLFIILVIPLISFFPVMDGYYYFNSVELFQEMVGLYIPLIFPALIVFIYLPDFVQEKVNNFIMYTRPRISLNIYILSKGITNAFLTGIILFLMIFFSYVFATFIEPNFLKLVAISPPLKGHYKNGVTFSEFLKYGGLIYGLVYSLWVALNAVLYTTISFLLMLIIRRPFISLSVPFLFYHVFNFVAGVFGVARFSPLSTIFPFNIEQQELWTTMVPFGFLITVGCILFVLAVREREEWMG
jgi:flagellar biosynthesis protein FliQ